MLKYLSYLSIQQENSSFCYRFEMALVEAYLMWRRKKYDWELIDRILEKSFPQRYTYTLFFIFQSHKNEVDITIDVTNL